MKTINAWNKQNFIFYQLFLEKKTFTEKADNLSGQIYEETLLCRVVKKESL